MSQPPEDRPPDPDQEPSQGPDEPPTQVPGNDWFAKPMSPSEASAPPPDPQPWYGQAGYGQQQPAYGQPYPQQPYPSGQPGYGYAQNHGRATTSMVLGIISLASGALALLCCVTLPGLFTAPFAWWLGAKAKREIDAAPPGTYGYRGSAQAGFVMGVIGTVLCVLSIIGIVLLVVLVVHEVDWSNTTYGYV
jgi:hypothetical protein